MQQLGAEVAVAQSLHDGVGLDAAVAHGDAGAAHQVAVAAPVEFLGKLAPEHCDGRAVAIGRRHAGAADLQYRLVQLGQAMQGELAFAVEASQPARGKVVQQAGGGDQLAAGQVTHTDMSAVAVEIVHVQPSSAPCSRASNSLLNTR